MPIIERRNAWTNNLADIQEAHLVTAAETQRVAAAVEAVAANQVDAEFLVNRINEITRSHEILAGAAVGGFEALNERMGEATEAIKRASTQIDLVAAEMARTANSVHAIARHFDKDEERDADLCTALYVMAVNDQGKFNEGTWLGSRLLRAYNGSIDKASKDEGFVRLVLELIANDDEAPRGLKDVDEKAAGCLRDRLRTVPKVLNKLQAPKK